MTQAVRAGKEVFKCWRNALIFLAVSMMVLTACLLTLAHSIDLNNRSKEVVWETFSRHSIDLNNRLKEVVWETFSRHSIDLNNRSKEVVWETFSWL